MELQSEDINDGPQTTLIAELQMNNNLDESSSQQCKNQNYYDLILPQDKESNNEDIIKDNTESNQIIGDNSEDEKEDFQFELHPLKVCQQS